MTVSPTAPADPSCHRLTGADLEAIAVDVWAAYLLSGQRPLLPAPTSLGADHEVMCGTVSVEGAWSGRVAVLLEPKTAHRVAEAMLGAPPEAREDVVDAVGELVNVVGGNVKSLMPSPSALSLPMVEQGPLSGLAAPPAATLCAVDLLWGDRPLRIVVQDSGPGQPPEPAEEEAKGAR